MNGGMGRGSWQVQMPAADSFPESVSREPTYPKREDALKIAIQELGEAMERRRAAIRLHESSIDDHMKAIAENREAIGRLSQAQENLRDDLRSM